MTKDKNKAAEAVDNSMEAGAADAGQADKGDENLESAPLDYRQIAENTMLGDLMACVKEQVKALPRSWQELNEAQQRDYLYRIELQCREAVKQAIAIIMAQDMITVNAMVESVTFKDGVKAVLKLTRGADGCHELADAEGAIVKIVIAHTDHLTSDNGKPVADKDQKDLPLADADGSHDGALEDAEQLENEAA